MKKKKIFGAKSVIMAGLVLALAAAVWLNMKYSSDAGGFLTTTNSTSSSAKNLGDTKYVMTESNDGDIETSAAESDYFTTARAERKKTREQALAIIEETLKDTSANDKAKEEAQKKKTVIADRMEKEASIETLIKAKNYDDAVVVIGDDSVSAVVKANEILQSQTLQIQDIITSQMEISLEKIKIIPIK